MDHPKNSAYFYGTCRILRGNQLPKKCLPKGKHRAASIIYCPAIPSRRAWSLTFSGNYSKLNSIRFPLCSLHLRLWLWRQTVGPPLDGFVLRVCVSVSVSVAITATVCNCEWLPRPKRPHTHTIPPKSLSLSVGSCLCGKLICGLSKP